MNRLIVHIQIVGPITIPSTTTTVIKTGYQREAVVNLVINGDDEIVIDWQAGSRFNWTNTREHTIVFSNHPSIALGFGQTILLTITNPGAATIMFGEDGYTLEVDEEQEAGGILPTVGKCKILADCSEPDRIFVYYKFSIVNKPV